MGGFLKEKLEAFRSIQMGGLRKRWLLNTASVVIALGLVCVLAVTASFAAYYYSNMESDMKYRARTTSDFFADYIDQTYNEFYQSCITYAQTFEDKDIIELQFINKQGDLVASSYGQASFTAVRRWRLQAARMAAGRRWRWAAACTASAAT